MDSTYLSGKALEPFVFTIATRKISVKDGFCFGSGPYGGRDEVKNAQDDFRAALLLGAPPSSPPFPHFPLLSPFPEISF